MLLFYFIYFFGCTVRLVGSWFPDQGSNPCPPQWKHRVLTTGLPGNSQGIIIIYILKMKKLRHRDVK